MFTSVTRPAAIVEPDDRNMNRPRSLQSAYSSRQIGRSTSISTTALVFFMRHLTTRAMLNISLDITTHQPLDNQTTPFHSFNPSHQSDQPISTTEKYILKSKKSVGDGDRHVLMGMANVCRCCWFCMVHYGIIVASIMLLFSPNILLSYQTNN